MDPHVQCPRCGQSDAIAKVTAIVADGTNLAETGTLGMPLLANDSSLLGFWGTSTSRSTLASQLAPPAKPSKPIGYGWAIILLIARSTLAVIVLLMTSAVAALTFPFLVTVYRQNPVLALIPVVGIIIGSLLLLRWIVVSLIRDVGKANNQSSAYAVEIEAWQRAMSRWKALYYCSRDDGVFLPSQSVLVPLSQMKPFLYSKAKEK